MIRPAHPGGPGRAHRTLALLLGLAVLATGCALRLAPAPAGYRALRISQLATEGDPARRASQRLVLKGLDEDVAGRPIAAQSAYERAIQIDPTNPCAYLALARHEVEARHWSRALEAVDQAEMLFGPDASEARVAAHIAGLRGAAQLGEGYGDGAAALLARAGRIAPEVWADGHLAAAELR